MKRIRVISLAVIAALSLTVTSFAAEKSPQQSAAAYLSEAGIMLGNESGDMMLEQGLTRAQMAALLTRIVTDPEQFETDSAFYRSLCSFTDVPEWAKSYVGYCVANNLVAGYGNGRYGSNDPVTSAAACTVMLRYLNDVDAVPSERFAYSRNAGRPLVKATNLPFSEVGWSSLIPMVQNVLDRYSLLMIDFKYQKSIISRPAKKGGTHGRLQTGRC